MKGINLIGKDLILKVMHKWKTTGLAQTQNWHHPQFYYHEQSYIYFAVRGHLVYVSSQDDWLWQPVKYAQDPDLHRLFVGGGMPHVHAGQGEALQVGLLKGFP